MQRFHCKAAHLIFGRFKIPAAFQNPKLSNCPSNNVNSAHSKVFRAWLETYIRAYLSPPLDIRKWELLRVLHRYEAGTLRHALGFSPDPTNMLWVPQKTLQGTLKHFLSPNDRKNAKMYLRRQKINIFWPLRRTLWLSLRSVEVLPGRERSGLSLCLMENKTHEDALQFSFSG